MVVARANELLGQAAGPRSVDELAHLWQALVEEFADTVPPTPEPAIADPGPEPPPDSRPEPAAAPDPGPDPGPDVGLDVGLDEIDLDDLVDAPAHTEQFIERVTEAFPGAELRTPEEHVE